MRAQRWWHVAVAVTVVVLAILLAAQRPSPTHLAGGITTMLVLATAWFALGPRAPASPPASFALIAAVIVTTGAATAFSPFLATLQCIAYPIVWFFAGSLRRALVANVLLVGSVGVGLTASTGTGPDALASTAITCVLSLGLSLGIGLWFTRVYCTITERQQLIDDLGVAQARLEALGREAGAMSERERLAREIHDTIAQDLAGLVLTAQQGRRELADGDAPAAAVRLEILEENARHALAETRALVASGAAAGVDGHGLAVALQRLGERSRRETGVDITVAVDDEPTLDRGSQVVLLRCAQEALANVRNHSAAARVSVVVRVFGDDVELRVSDDGRGFDASSTPSGFGLGGMRERLALVGGRLAVTSAPGAGTTLVASLPVPRVVPA
ncbi:MAG: sensor histidine kinase [Acidobacteria bacterium]|nr:sensor histidine kinase [Acidobacteriota bacterium]